MHWTRFQEKAKAVHSKFFFKRTARGYEVWDVAQIAGPGFPRKYLVMVIPFGTNSVGFSMMLGKLKRGNWIRRLGLQSIMTEQAMKNNRTHADEKWQKFVQNGKEATKALASMARKVAEEHGITENRTRLNMRGVDWDDTKKVLRRELEKRGAFE